MIASSVALYWLGLTRPLKFVSVVLLVGNQALLGEQPAETSPVEYAGVRGCSW